MGMEEEKWSTPGGSITEAVSVKGKERDKDEIVRECHGMPLEREGFDGNKLRS